MYVPVHVRLRELSSSDHTTLAVNPVAGTSIQVCMAYSWQVAAEAW